MAKITIVFNAISLGTHNLNLKGVGNDEKKLKKKKSKELQRITPAIHYLQPQNFTYFSNPARFWTREVTVARAGTSKCAQRTQALWWCSGQADV